MRLQIISGKRIYCLIIHKADVLRTIKFSAIICSSLFFYMVLMGFVIFSVWSVSKVLFNPL